MYKLLSSLTLDLRIAACEPDLCLNGEPDGRPGQEKEEQSSIRIHRERRLMIHPADSFGEAKEKA